MSSSPYGAPTSGSTGRGPENPGKHPNWHDSAIRNRLIAAGYNVRRAGGWTARAADAWQHYLKNSRSNIEPSKKAARDWNNSKVGKTLAPSLQGSPASRHGGADTGPAGGHNAWLKANHPGAKGGKTPKPTYAPGYGPGNKKKGSGGAGGAGGVSGKGGKSSSGGGGKVLTGAGLKMIPEAMAKQLADQQFGGKIAAAKQAIAQNLAQTKGDISNIGDWTQQVQDQIAKGQASTQAAYKGAAADEGANAAAIAQAMGGDVGSNLVRAQGQNAQNLETTLGSDTNSRDEQMKMIMAQAAAQAKTNEQNLGNQRNTQGQLNLQDLLGQQGAAQTQSLMDILNQNNSVRQQNYQNSLQGLQTQAALAMSGAQYQNLVSQTNAMQQQSNGGFTPWQHLNPSQKQSLLTAAMSSFGPVKDVAGENHAKDALRQYLLGQGFKNARFAIKGKAKGNAAAQSMLQLIQNTVQGAYNQYTSANPPTS